MCNDLLGQRGAHTVAGTSRHHDPSTGISMPFGLKADCTVHEALFRRFPPSLFPSSQKTLFPFNTMGKCRTRLKGRTRSIVHDRFADLYLDFGALNIKAAWSVRPPLKFCRGPSLRVNVSAHSLLMCGIWLGHVVWQCS